MKDIVITLDQYGEQLVEATSKTDKFFNRYNTKKLCDHLRGILKAVPNLAEIKKQLDPNERFQLVIDQEMMKQIEDGTLKLIRRKDNAENILPIFADSNNKFKKQVQLKEIYRDPDLNVPINGLIIQQQFKEVLDKIEEMNVSIERMLQGQENDRIAIQHSAQQLVLEANNVQDVNFKRLLLSQAIKTANDSRFLLLETMKQDIEYIEDLPKTTWQHILSNQSSKKIEERVDSIRKAFIAINAATMTCCIAYYQMEEFEAMKSSILPYKKMIQGYLESEKQPLKCLNEYDSRIDGFWIQKPKEILRNIECIECGKMERNLIIDIPIQVLMEE